MEPRTSFVVFQKCVINQSWLNDFFRSTWTLEDAMDCECGWDSKPWKVGDLGKRKLVRIKKFDMAH